jgi:hypothetical protein
MNPNAYPPLIFCCQVKEKTMADYGKDKNGKPLTSHQASYGHGKRAGEKQGRLDGATIASGIVAATTAAATVVLAILGKKK